MDKNNKNYNPMLHRLVEFAASKGGFAEIGRRLSKRPEMFYNLMRRDALPSLATLQEIAIAFPDLDLNYLIKGDRTISEEVEKLRAELERERAIVNRLAMPGKTKGAILSPGKIVRRKENKSFMFLATSSPVRTQSGYRFYYN